MNNETSASSIFLAMLGGAVVGAGLALLYAPQSGKKTRQDLQDIGDDAVEYAKDMVERAEAAVAKAKKKGEHWMEKGQDILEEKRRQLAEAAAQL
jgi:gas vesicle protein